MGRRHRGWSAGTVAMALATAVVLCCAAAAIVMIRGGSRELAVDAERVSGAIGALIDSMQPTEAPRPNAGAPALPQATAIPTQGPAAERTAGIITARPAAERRTVTLTVSGLILPSQKLLNGTLGAPETLLSGISNALYADLNLAFIDASAYAADGGWWTQALRSAGFDSAVPLGTGQNENALQAARAALSAAGLKAEGVGAERFSLRVVNGVTIAFIACAEGASGAASWPPVYEAEAFARAVADARAQGAQAVVACIRWRNGSASAATDAQRAIAQAMADAGADVILGARSGLVLPVENIWRADGGRALVAWSLGTFLSDNRDTRAAVSGCLLHLALSCDAQSGALEVVRVEFTPSYIWGQGEDGTTRYRVVQSALPAPEGMNERQQEIMARALKLIQDAMYEGIAAQR